MAVLNDLHPVGQSVRKHQFKLVLFSNQEYPLHLEFAFLFAHSLADVNNFQDLLIE